MTTFDESLTEILIFNILNLWTHPIYFTNNLFALIFFINWALLELGL